LRTLENLTIATSRIEDISDLRGLTSMRDLTLAYLPNLRSLEGVQNMSSLERLRVENCKKINNIDEVLDLTNLIYLNVVNCGTIDSLKPVGNLKKVKFLELVGTTVADGDLAFLHDLPSLIDVRFSNHRHYNARYQEFPPWINEAKRSL
jgi:Leucine-rich repeat (LRR) protein